MIDIKKSARTIKERIRGISNRTKVFILTCGPLIISLFLGLLFAFTSLLNETFSPMQLSPILSNTALIGVMVVCLLYPPLLSLANITGMITAAVKPPWHQKNSLLTSLFHVTDWMTIILGAAMSWLYNIFTDIRWDATWDTQLYNNQMHPPVWTGAAASVLVLCAAGVCGLFLLKYKKTEQTPPLVFVIAIGAMYLGASQAVLFILQLMQVSNPLMAEGFNGRSPFSSMFPLMVLPANYLLMAARVLILKIREWNADPEHDAELFAGNDIMARLNNRLRSAERWPLYGLLAMLPVLGVLLAVLALFGQYPDRLIRAWTDTAGWSFSTKTHLAPQNALVDEHYLCTVAAGGHAQIVKPLRFGTRHGHRIIVNRQLLIANAFEELLQEKMPRVHRALRSFYDTHGYSVSKLIHTKTQADAVYFIMKPLEWFFLVVLYLFDVKPEHRIVRQYPDRIQ